MGLWRHKDFGKRIAQLMHQEFGIPKKESAAAARAAYELLRPTSTTYAPPARNTSTTPAPTG